ncbi:glycine betaine ABC transporter substrate-binding protein [Granulicoccus sp. GXG6511]|uniref:glycine betaine ABC transporter substrate-binding protein n=1 Tax=Granulicoccus sp. GXG6511 TaxID=3381351 RepID=UPI003D7F17B6
MSTKPIVLGRIDESFHQVAAAVVEEVLIRLGHEVEVIEGAHPDMYPQLAAGQQDLFADAWLPHGHEVYWAQIKDVVTEVAPLYDGGLFFWAVPGYVPQDVVASLADLAKPEVAERFTTRLVQGTKAGAGLSMRSNRLVTEYGLDKLGWSHEIGDIWAVIDTVNTRMAAGDWFATPMWQPMFLNDVHELRPLQDPLGVFPPPDRASLLAYSDFWNRMAERDRTVLGRIRYTVEDVNEMDRWMQLDDLDALAAAKRWMDENADQVAGWFA